MMNDMVIPVDKFFRDRGREEPSGSPEPELAKNKFGNPICNISNVKTILRTSREWQGVIAFDLLAGRLMLMKPIPDASGRKPNNFQPRPYTDADTLVATVWFQRNGFPLIGKQIVDDGLRLIGEERAFDPLMDHFRSLVWDGKERLSTWLPDICGAPIDDSQPEAYLRAVGRAYLISGAARAVSPGVKVDSAIVLVGPQGAGKSSVGRIMGYEKWFSDGLPDIGSKDAADHLRGLLIVEIGEMATTSKADVETMKAYMTRTKERFRPAYGRNEIEYNRRCIFLGTSNRDQFLKDDTGNRRFWPVNVTAVDLPRLEAERDQLWAEALHAFDNGEQWHLGREAEALASKQQAAFVIRDERADTLTTKLLGRTTTSVLECCDLLGLDHRKAFQMEVAGMLRTIGWARRGGKTRHWVPVVTTSRAEGSHRDHLNGDFG